MATKPRGVNLVHRHRNSRNRVLRFSLEMKKSSGDTAISSEAVGDIVERQIFSGQRLDWT